jgi:hypothetical protein
MRYDAISLDPLDAAQCIGVLPSWTHTEEAFQITNIQTRLAGSRHRQHLQVSGSLLSMREQGLVDLENGNLELA